MIFTQNDFSGGGFNSLTSTLRLLCPTRFVDRSFLVCDYLFCKEPGRSRGSTSAGISGSTRPLFFYKVHDHISPRSFG